LESQGNAGTEGARALEVRLSFTSENWHRIESDGSSADHRPGGAMHHCVCGIWIICLGGLAGDKLPAVPISTVECRFTHCVEGRGVQPALSSETVRHES
jgi:hypothetical protein